MGCLQPADDIPRLPSGLEHQSPDEPQLGAIPDQEHAAERAIPDQEELPNGNASKGLTAKLSSRMSGGDLVEILRSNQDGARMGGALQRLAERSSPRLVVPRPRTCDAPIDRAADRLNGSVSWAHDKSVDRRSSRRTGERANGSSPRGAGATAASGCARPGQQVSQTQSSRAL
jgi:hypothetical protein